MNLRFDAGKVAVAAVVFGAFQALGFRWGVITALILQLFALIEIFERLGGGVA